LETVGTKQRDHPCREARVRNASHAQSCRAYSDSAPPAIAASRSRAGSRQASPMAIADEEHAVE